LAETEGMYHFLTLLAAQRRIIHGLAPGENFREAYELALNKSVAPKLRVVQNGVFDT
jgi:hypothetical protein